MRRSLTDPNDRWRSALLATAMNLAIGYAIVTGLGVHSIPRPDEALKLFRLSDAPPPPPSIVPPPPEKTKSQTHKPKDPEGAAAPPALKNSPTDIAAPKAKLPPPPPIRAAPVPGQGTAPAAGAAPIPGPGIGRGGTGNGTGSGLSGTGTGGGGSGGADTEAEMIAGSIGDEDYPPAALVDRAQGTVHFAFTVELSGRIGNCRVTRSSGNRALDAVTCRLATQRFRFRPARDTAGRPISTDEEGEQSWRLGTEREIIDPPPR